MAVAHSESRNATYFFQVSLIFLLLSRGRSTVHFVPNLLEYLNAIVDSLKHAFNLSLQFSVRHLARGRIQALCTGSHGKSGASEAAIVRLGYGIGGYREDMLRTNRSNKYKDHKRRAIYATCPNVSYFSNDLE